jgi:rod shape determining protein RodA
MSTTAIQPGDESVPVVEPRRWLLFDPLLVLGALGLIACSLVTLKGATRTSVPGSAGCPV